MNLRALSFLSTLALGLVPCITPAAPPEAHLAANGESSTRSIPRGTIVGLFLRLEANDQAGQEADGSFVRHDAEGWSSLRLRAAFAQGFHDLAAGLFTGPDEIPRVGREYLNRPATEPGGFIRGWMTLVARR